MNRIFGTELTQEDRKLIHQIEIDIKKHPDRYRDAGKWLDEQFYNEASYWQRLENRVESIEAEAMNPENALSREELDEAKDLRNLLKTKPKPYKSDKFSEAIRSLLEKYRIEPFPCVHTAKAVCLITWLLTDPEAHLAKLGLTRFEKFLWHDAEPSNKLPGAKVLEGRFNHLISMLVQQWRIWMQLVRAAWAKVEVERDLAAVQAGTKTEKALQAGVNGVQKREPLSEHIRAVNRQIEDLVHLLSLVDSDASTDAPDPVKDIDKLITNLMKDIRAAQKIAANFSHALVKNIVTLLVELYHEVAEIKKHAERVCFSNPPEFIGVAIKALTERFKRLREDYHNSLEELATKVEVDHILQTRKKDSEEDLERVENEQHTKTSGSDNEADTAKQPGTETEKDLQNGTAEHNGDKITKDEANVRARALIKQNPSITARQLAQQIPCSLGLVSHLPAWKALQDYKRKTFGSKKPKIVPLTKELEYMLGTKDEQLNQLIAEQAKDGKEKPRLYIRKQT